VTDLSTAAISFLIVAAGVVLGLHAMLHKPASIRTLSADATVARQPAPTSAVVVGQVVRPVLVRSIDSRPGGCSGRGQRIVGVCRGKVIQVTIAEPQARIDELRPP
jgi:hypothetical protein